MIQGLSGALSQLQREQKKHSVHLATLRAQVRKNAGARDDALGPQWSSWVSKTVIKLEEQGVLEAPAPGHVTFTPDVRKDIAAARRELGVATSYGAAAEDHIIKTVASSISCGGKRRRRSSILNMPLNVDKDDEEPRSASCAGNGRNSLPNKRVRMQNDVPSSWTKSKLLGQYKSLNEARMGDQSKLAELDRLREELSILHRKLEEVELENEELRQRSREEYCDTPTRLSADNTGSHSFVLETPASSPLRPNLPNVITNCSSVPGVIRTESGSLIDHYSKQPTPAPSTPGPAGVNDSFDYSVRDQSFHDDVDVFSAPQGLATPTATPRMTTRTLTPSPGDSESRGHVSSLHGAVEARESELRALRKTHDQLVAARIELQELLSTRNADIAGLRAELQERAKTVYVLQAELAAANAANSASVVSEEDMRKVLDSEKSAGGRVEFDICVKRSLLGSLFSTKEQLRDQVADLNNAITTLRTSYDRQGSQASEKDKLNERLLVAAEVENSLQDALCAASMKFSELNSRHRDLESRYSSVEQSLRAVESQLVQAKERLGRAESDLFKTSEERRQALSRSADLESKLLEAQVSMDTLQQDIETANKAVDEKEAMITRQTLALKELQDRERSLKAEGASLNTAITTLHTQAADKNATIETLRAALHTATARITLLEATIVEKGADITKLQGIRDVAEEQVSELAAQLRASEARCTRLGLLVASVQGELKEMASNAERFQTDLARSQQAYGTLEAELESVKSNNDTFQLELRSKVAEVASLQVDLGRARDTERRLQLRVVEIQDEKVAHEERFRNSLAAVQDSLNASEAESRNLRSSLQALRDEKRELKSLLCQRETELTSAQTASSTEGERAENLQAQLREAVARVETAEREADELHEAKLEDERNMAVLQEAFQQFRKVQLENLAQAERKISSAVLSPMPKGRRSSIMPADRKVKFRSAMMVVLTSNRTEDILAKHLDTIGLARDLRSVAGPGKRGPYNNRRGREPRAGLVVIGRTRVGLEMIALTILRSVSNSETDHVHAIFRRYSPISPLVTAIAELSQHGRPMFPGGFGDLFRGHKPPSVGKVSTRLWLIMYPVVSSMAFPCDPLQWKRPTSYPILEHDKVRVRYVRLAYTHNLRRPNTLISLHSPDPNLRRRSLWRLEVHLDPFIMLPSVPARAVFADRSTATYASARDWTDMQLPESTYGANPLKARVQTCLFLRTRLLLPFETQLKDVSTPHPPRVAHSSPQRASAIHQAMAGLTLSATL
ncbi:hypothetical protein NM688_g1019 [Phlebia brevispora]|uniref:Uncharacterized protein n=1 Tax=Phlebia brevispora TaxID=194682 RepID=A0ACC1TCD3_9APHY|nr:hypothetical protein NM688_g1019 [Phlebia brevispora]